MCDQVLAHKTNVVVRAHLAPSSLYYLEPKIIRYNMTMTMTMTMTIQCFY